MANKKESSPTTFIELYTDLNSTVKYSLGTAIEEERIRASIQKIIDAFLKEPYNPLLLYFYNMSKENYLISHISNSVILAVGFGVSLNLPKKDLFQLALCAFCHDFGMKDYTHLFQKQRELNQIEERMIRKHPLKSAEMFEEIFPKEVIDAIQDVHEQVNGQGYPKGKLEGQISFLAKLIAICDVYEALTHQRNSRKKMIPYEAMKIIIKQKEKIFDARVVKRFIDFMSIYPIGSLVILNTGESGIVCGNNYGFPTRSIVRVLLTANNEIDPSEKILDLINEKMIYISGPVPLNEESEMLDVLKPRGEFDF